MCFWCLSQQDCSALSVRCAGTRCGAGLEFPRCARARVSEGCAEEEEGTSRVDSFVGFRLGNVRGARLFLHGPNPGLTSLRRVTPRGTINASTVTTTPRRLSSANTNVASDHPPPHRSLGQSSERKSFASCRTSELARVKSMRSEPGSTGSCVSCKQPVQEAVDATEKMMREITGTQRAATTLLPPASLVASSLSMGFEPSRPLSSFTSSLVVLERDVGTTPRRATWIR